jgi:hypothetical protein
MQPLLGKILDSHWQGELIDGARVYTEAAYNAAFFWLVVCAALSIMMIAFTKETYCRMCEA